MGSSLLPSRPLNQQDSLQFYTTVNDPNVGECQVYSVRHLPMCYILKVKRKSSSIHSVFRSIQNHQSQSLLSMYAFVKVNYCDCKNLVSEGIVFYWQYFNFYLEDMLERRMAKNSGFKEEEIWHCVQVCLESYEVFKKHKIFYSFTPEMIVLTPEGKLKVFWANLEESNAHLPYFQYFAAQGNQYQLSYYSPQELESMKNRHRNLNINFQKCNVFSFGMLIMFMATLFSPVRLYKDYFHLDYHSMNVLIEKAGTMYSKDVWFLLKGCLDVSAGKRPTFEQIGERFKGRMKDQFSILVHGKEAEVDLKKEKEYKMRRISLKKKSTS